MTAVQNFARVLAQCSFEAGERQVVPLEAVLDAAVTLVDQSQVERLVDWAGQRATLLHITSTCRRCDVLVALAQLGEDL